MLNIKKRIKDIVKTLKLPDVAVNSEPPHQMHIQKVGIRELCTPIRFIRKDKTIQQLEVNVSMYVSLNEKTKGISMSRLPRILYDYLDKDLSAELMLDILQRFRDELDSETSFIKFNFKYPIKKKAPVTGLEAWEYYKCTLERRLDTSGVQSYLTVAVPYASYCPCSTSLAETYTKASSEAAFPHAQQCAATVKVEFKDFFYIEDLVKLIEDAVIVIPYPIIKREDECALAALAGKVQLFAEDAARLVASQISKATGILDWSVVVNHFESIHNHSVVAVISAGKKEGLR
jgi:GTP cyclohydrolase I